MSPRWPEARRLRRLRPLLGAILACAAPGAAAQPPATGDQAPLDAADIAPLEADEWRRFTLAIDALRACVERTRAGRTPAQTAAALQRLGLAGEMRAQALALLPGDDPARAAVAAAGGDAEAIVRSFQAVSAWRPARQLDRARALAYVYHFEAQATDGACLPSADFLSNYQKTLS